MYKATFEKQVLKFKIPAGTSRGILKDRPTWILKIWNSESPQIIGIGECAPLIHLSIDDRPDFENKLTEVCNNIQQYEYLNPTDLLEFPSIRIGLEMAWLDLKNGGKRIYYPDTNKENIPINGLIWMGDFDFMKSQADQKLKENWGCIKVKIGAIDFEKELALLAYIRGKSDSVELRVDANCAFNSNNVYDKLKALSKYNLHSIEQPIATNQWDEMAEICKKSPIPVGLDEELIGIYGDKKEALINHIQPQYLVLKPTLLGGFSLTQEWIDLASKYNMNWWITSTLEGSIGLEALKQYTATLKFTTFQGLGTGKLFQPSLCNRKS